MAEVRASRPLERRTVESVGERYIEHVRGYREAKPSTLQDYDAILRQAVEHFGAKPVDRITPDEVDAYRDAKIAAGRATKTVSNHLVFLGGLFGFAVKRQWASTNPVEAVDRPRPAGPNPDIRYLDATEVERLLDAIPSDAKGPTDRVLYMTATMCGLRQGELIAMRWQDVDWGSGVIRVRRSFTRGKFGTPKSRRSNRAVPMPARLARELERHHEDTVYRADDDLVFPHPATGAPYDPSNMRKRFKEAITRARVGAFVEVAKPRGKVEMQPLTRFHDLRHTYGTRIAKTGAPLRDIQAWMGHSDYKTTLIYADFAPDPTRDAGWAEAAFPASSE